MSKKMTQPEVNKVINQIEQAARQLSIADREGRLTLTAEQQDRVSDVSGKLSSIAFRLGFLSSLRRSTAPLSDKPPAE
jgi:hypothetical protein